MPEKKTMERAKKAKREGKAPSTQAGAFVHEEIEHVREGKHGARNTKQAIAIGLSKARRAGVKLRAPKKGAASASTRAKAKRDLAKGTTAKKKTTRARRPSATRSRAVKGALKREGRTAASSRALSRQARAAAKGRRPKRGASARRAKPRAEA
jgi:hypothetical protein